jgi:hypothetical protein
MAAGIYNLTLEQGTTSGFKIQYKDVSGSAIDLTGYDASMQIKSNYADTNPITYLTLSSSLNSDGTGLNMSSASDGYIGIFISACSSSILNFNNAKYDLEIYSGSIGGCPITTRILEGQVKLSKEITRT